jgi:hypothetical protein
MQKNITNVALKKFPRRRGRARTLSNRDFQMLKYIWRWKISSTASIHGAVNPALSPYSTYKALVKLEIAQFIRADVHLVETFYVWQLTEKGFYAIKEFLGDLKEDGYLSENHYHDRLVQALHLGDWSRCNLPQVIHFTEQEMRRREMDGFPDWVPQTTEHRADGYTRFIGPARSWTFAYEVELSVKAVHKYEAILRFYRTSRSADRVIWLTSSQEVRSAILRAKSCIRDDSTNFHVFIDQEEFLSTGWDAKVINESSETLFTLRTKYGDMLGDSIGSLLGPAGDNVGITEHLDGRKVLGKSRT